MTIALAIQESDGIVMAADTLQSTDYIKGDEHKIATVFKLGIPGACAIAGAGDAGYVDAFTRELSQVFVDDPSATHKDLFFKFGEHLKGFHKDHVIPFLPLPYHERPEIDMLIGVYRDQPVIFVTDRTTIRVPLRRYMAIGKGADFADILLRRFWKPSNVGAAQILAAYIVFRVKEAVETCGNYTTIVTLKQTEEKFQDGSTNTLVTPKYLPARDIDNIERDFREWWTREEQELLWRKIADYHSTDHVTLSNP